MIVFIQIHDCIMADEYKMHRHQETHGDISQVMCHPSTPILEHP